LLLPLFSVEPYCIRYAAEDCEAGGNWSIADVVTVRFAERMRALFHRRYDELHERQFPADHRRLSIGGESGTL